MLYSSSEKAEEILREADQLHFDPLENYVVCSPGSYYWAHEGQDDGWD